MNRYLLDTHVVLWILFDVDKIPISTLEIIKDIDNEIFISAASFWEISIKYNLNKLDINNFNVSELPKIFTEQGYKIMSISSNETSTLWQLKLDHHKDPFDRILIWQAITNNFIFISNDINMSPYKMEGLRLMW